MDDFIKEIYPDKPTIGQVIGFLDTAMCLESAIVSPQTNTFIEACRTVIEKLREEDKMTKDKTFEAIIAYDENGEGWILRQSDDAIETDLLPEGNSTFDNNVDLFKDGKKVNSEMQVVRVELTPWSYHDTMTGEHDAGCEAEIKEVLWRYDMHMEREDDERNKRHERR